MFGYLRTIAVMVFAMLWPALTMAAPAASADGGFCTATANTLFKACSAEVQDDYFVVTATCLNISDAADREECVADAKEGRREGDAACREELDWREDGCDLTGEDRYDPDFDPDSFDKDFRKPRTSQPLLPAGDG
jgi:hypothetical protein